MKHTFLMALVMALFMVGCSKDDDGHSSIRLKVSTTDNTTSSRSNTIGKRNENVVFTDFRISIRDVVFKNDDDPNSNLDTDEIQFRGPYQIDLLDGGNALSQTIGDAVVPDGRYKELRFKFHKDEDLPATDNLYDRSIYMEGTIGDQPFVFWHDTSENLDVGRSTGVDVVGGTVNFTVTFNTSQFLSALKEIDLTQATDGNGNGIIEIFPNDQDGNQNIAKDLKDNIKATADLINQ
ncbi:DUF4382 domain-containing protein [Flagellimonas nanhaiensis]|uniref:DUF4382 domain-containing protein n=1 Tax=Flagellimonas nanhaiensis TaxID=2292706 RepID=A0A371JN12_9FLAO|nr:DUF4382 domain-containing protein [Allomuricauda nanhaiensis]RDY58631.1 DUF4382 domain-containing protein [Allomuricauda nanhaiensis]